MHKLIVFGAGVIIGAIGAVVVLSKLSEKDREQDYCECEGYDCDCCDSCMGFEDTQQPAELQRECHIDMTDALEEMRGRFYCGMAKHVDGEQGIKHFSHCRPAHTDNSVDWDDPCLECTNKGVEPCDKGIKNCPFAYDATADKTSETNA